MSTVLSPGGPAAEYVSTARLRRATRIIARIVAAPGGEIYAELFERLEDEIKARERSSSAQARARAWLNQAQGRAP